MALPNRCLSKWSTDAPEEHLVAEARVELRGSRSPWRRRCRRSPAAPRTRRPRRCRRPGGCSAAGRPPAPTGVACGPRHPDVGVLGDVGGDPVAHVLGEGLVEPQVVPPRRGDEVAEPLVRHLVRDRAGAGDVAACAHPAREDQRVAERDAARVLHRAGVELGHERLVVVAERVADAEQPVELVEALPVSVNSSSASLSRSAAMLARALRPSGMPSCSSRTTWYGPGDEGDEVRRQRLGLLELPDARSRPRWPGRCR